MKTRTACNELNRTSSLVLVPVMLYKKSHTVRLACLRNYLQEIQILQYLIHYIYTRNPIGINVRSYAPVMPVMCLAGCVSTKARKPFELIGSLWEMQTRAQAGRLMRRMRSRKNASKKMISAIKNSAIWFQTI